jgi:hypothetical protein
MKRPFCAVAATLLLFPSVGEAGSVVGRVRDSGGRPLASVSIEVLALDDGASGRDRSAEQRKLSGTAAPDGTFRILVPADWPVSEIRVSAAGTVKLRPPDVVTGSDDIDLGLLTLSAAQVLQGVVRDENAQAVAGARVKAMSFDGGAEVLPGEGMTDSFGRYLIVDAPERVVQMMVAHPDYVPQVAPRTRSSWVLKRGGAVEGVVVDDQGHPASGVRITAEDHITYSGVAGTFAIRGLPSGISHVSASDNEGRVAATDVVVVDRNTVSATLSLQTGTIVRGFVRDLSDGRAVPRTRIRVYQGSAFSVSPQRERTAISNASGTFQIIGLEPGQYMFEAQRSGYLRAVQSHTLKPAARTLEIGVLLTREARIEGRVTDAADRPIAGARVVVSESNPMQELARQLRAGKRESVSTRSNQDGLFVLRGLWPGRALRVEVSAETFVPGRIDGIELPAGAVRSNLTLRLHAGATATGLVTDQQDQPLAGVKVYATRIEETGATSAAAALLQGSPAAAATTDPQGRYVLTGLEPGRYFQTFLLSGYSRGLIPATAIVAGTINELPAIKLGSAAHVRGRVVDEQQQPLAGANVFVIDRTLEVASAVSDANGEFEISNLSEGEEVSLQVESEGAAPGHVKLRVPAAGVTVQLSSALILRGRVYDATTDQPITDFSVERVIRTPGATTFRLGGSAARSFHDDEGAFELNRVPPGPCVLRVRSPGFQAAEIAVPIVPPPAAIAVPMTRGLSVAGRVLLAGSRQPVPNATVAWRPRDAARSELEAIFASLATGEDTTATDADGQFVLEDLPGGNITLFVSHAEYAPSRTNVTVPARSSVEVTMTSGATLAGVVILDQGGPSTGAVVAVTAAGERMGMMPPDTATTDGTGRFRLSRLRAGSYTLVARAPTGASLPRTVAVAGTEERNDLVLTLKSGTTIRGSVHGLRREAQANIFVMAHGEGYYDSTYTDAAGAFTVPHVPAGTIALEATTSFGQGLSAGTRLDIPENGPGTIDVEIEFGGQAELVGVVSRAGRPASSVLISATPVLPTVTTRGRAASDVNGSYRIEGLTDGRYQLVFSGPAGRYHRTADVQGSTRLDIELPSASITGMVTDAESQAPVADVDVIAVSGQERTSADIRRATTDSSGRYMLTDLDAGTYQVRATRSGYQQEVRMVNVQQTDERWDLALHRRSGIRLRIVDALNGAPVARASVRLTTRGVLAFADTLTLDNAGRGELPTPASGDYVLAVMVDGYAPRSLAVQLPISTIEVSVEPGGRVQLRLPAATSTRVRLLDAAGIPQVVSGSDPAGWTAVVGPTTVWTNVATGSYRLESMIGGVTSFVVTSGATSVVDVK